MYSGAEKRLGQKWRQGGSVGQEGQWKGKGQNEVTEESNTAVIGRERRKSARDTEGPKTARNEHKHKQRTRSEKEGKTRTDYK